MFCTVPLTGTPVSTNSLSSSANQWHWLRNHIIFTWKTVLWLWPVFLLMFLQYRHITESYLDVTCSQCLKFCQESSFLKKKHMYIYFFFNQIYHLCFSDTHSSTICAIPLHAHQLFWCANIQSQHQTEQARSLLHISCLDGWKQWRGWCGWPWYSGILHFQMVLFIMILLLKCGKCCQRLNYPDTITCSERWFRTTY